MSDKITKRREPIRELDAVAQRIADSLTGRGVKAEMAEAIARLERALTLLEELVRGTLGRLLTRACGSAPLWEALRGELWEDTTALYAVLYAMEHADVLASFRPTERQVRGEALRLRTDAALAAAARRCPDAELSNEIGVPVRVREIMAAVERAMADEGGKEGA